MRQSQLVFVAIVSLVLYGTFVLVQTVRHRDYFLPAEDAEDEHAEPPTTRDGRRLRRLLLVALVGGGAAGQVAVAAIEARYPRRGAPLALVGVIIAALVLLPESLAALRAARRNRLQTSLNLALGSALATIGLTIPAVAVVSLVLDLPLRSGSAPRTWCCWCCRCSPSRCRSAPGAPPCCKARCTW